MLFRLGGGQLGGDKRFKRVQSRSRRKVDVRSRAIAGARPTRRSSHAGRSLPSVGAVRQSSGWAEPRRGRDGVAGCYGYIDQSARHGRAWPSRASGGEVGWVGLLRSGRACRGRGVGGSGARISRVGWTPAWPLVQVTDENTLQVLVRVVMPLWEGLGRRWRGAAVGGAAGRDCRRQGRCQRRFQSGRG